MTGNREFMGPAEAEPQLQARCAWCGTVDVAAGAFEVHVGADGDALFQFSCPRCVRRNLGPLDSRDLATLLAAGLRPARGPAPFELLEEHSGPPITWDDIIDFHEALARAGTRWSVSIEPLPDTGWEQERDAA